MSKNWRAFDSSKQRHKTETPISHAEIVCFLTYLGKIRIPPTRQKQIIPLEDIDQCVWEHTHASSSSNDLSPTPSFRDITYFLQV